jgi:hypothetical protein
MAFDIVPGEGRTPARVTRQLSGIKHDALVAASRVQAAAFVHDVAVLSAANMMRTSAAVAGGDPAIQMALAQVTAVGINVINAIQAEHGLMSR